MIISSCFARHFPYLCVILVLISCNPDRSMDQQKINEEVRQMLNSYYSDVNREGLMAEFRYLDDSPDFSWIPPGYQSALSYDSVRAEVERNARLFKTVNFRWDTLRVIPLAEDVANYSGVVRGSMTDTAGIQSVVALLESGTVIRRSDGWKILNGHTTVLENQSDNAAAVNNKPRVTGIGGIFFKSENPQKLKEWYNKHLGLQTDQWGTNFEWRQADEGTQKGFTQWSPFTETTTYFEPSTRDFMVNYRVENLEALIEELKNNGVTILDEIEEYEYGKFVHILDLEGNKVELWEPDDEEYDNLVEGRTK